MGSGGHADGERDPHRVRRLLGLRAVDGQALLSRRAADFLRRESPGSGGGVIECERECLRGGGSGEHLQKQKRNRDAPKDVKHEWIWFHRFGALLVKRRPAAHGSQGLVLQNRLTKYTHRARVVV